MYGTGREQREDGGLLQLKPQARTVRSVHMYSMYQHGGTHRKGQRARWGGRSCDSRMPQSGRPAGGYHAKHAGITQHTPGAASAPAAPKHAGAGSKAAAPFLECTHRRATTLPPRPHPPARAPPVRPGRQSTGRGGTSGASPPAGAPWTAATAADDGGRCGQTAWAGGRRWPPPPPPPAAAATRRQRRVSSPPRPQ